VAGAVPVATRTVARLDAPGRSRRRRTEGTARRSRRARSCPTASGRRPGRAASARRRSAGPVGRGPSRRIPAVPAPAEVAAVWKPCRRRRSTTASAAGRQLPDGRGLDEPPPRTGAGPAATDRGRPRRRPPRRPRALHRRPPRPPACAPSSGRRPRSSRRWSSPARAMSSGWPSPGAPCT
jgi:hypothetical protein